MGKHKKSGDKFDRLANAINLIAAIINLVITILLLIDKMAG